jgi:hypothetical protein
LISSIRFVHHFLFTDSSYDETSPFLHVFSRTWFRWSSRSAGVQTLKKRCLTFTRDIGITGVGVSIIKKLPQSRKGIQHNFTFKTSCRSLTVQTSFRFISAENLTQS